MRKRYRLEGIPDRGGLDRAIATGLADWLGEIASENGRVPSSPLLRHLVLCVGQALRDQGADTSHPETKARLVARLGLKVRDRRH